ncbi:MAG: GntR family transcriptional regulator [Rhizobiaceae bacterium]|nr:GntR family transcriptional regulator [Rhizobiaceae bacterium]
MDIRRADKIAEELEQLILTGNYSDGERLDEVRLAQQFGVSRTPVREALQKLTLSGLVEQLPRRGVFVCQPGPVELLEMFEYMAEIEAVCGRLAAKRISDAALVSLQEANTKCQQAVEANEADEYYRENEQFHHIIYKQSGNGFLEQEALRLHRRLKPFRRIQLHLRGRMKQSLAEHKEIVQALSDNKPDQAANALRGHVAVQGEKFHHLMINIKTAAE